MRSQRGWGTLTCGPPPVTPPCVSTAPTSSPTRLIVVISGSGEAGSKPGCVMEMTVRNGANPLVKRPGARSRLHHAYSGSAGVDAVVTALVLAAPPTFSWRPEQRSARSSAMRGVRVCGGERVRAAPGRHVLG